MKIHVISVGPIRTNCYLVEDEKSKDCLIIDPGDNAEAIIKLIDQEKLKPSAIFLTHGHYDHAGAVRTLKDHYQIPFLMHQRDLWGLPLVNAPAPDKLVEDGEKLVVGNLSFKIICNPGHTPGGLSLYCAVNQTLFSGDTLFAGTWGRTDLPYSSEKEMVVSLKKLLALPPETKVYPGHGRSTTIGAELSLLKEV